MFHFVYIGLYDYLYRHESLETYEANMIKAFPLDYKNVIRQLMTNL